MQATAGAVRLTGFNVRCASIFEYAKSLPRCHGHTGGEGTGHRLEAAEQSAAVVNGDHAPVHYAAGESDRPPGRTPDGVSGCRRKVHAAVAGQPALRRFIESPNNSGFGGQRPLPSTSSRGPRGAGHDRSRGSPQGGAGQGQGEGHQRSRRAPGVPGVWGSC